MLAFTALVTFCLTTSTATVSSVLSKPYYEIDDAENLFKDFVSQYNRSYNHEEYSKRLEIFKESLKEINLRNAKHPRTVFKVNHFADLTREERLQYRGFKLPIGKRRKLVIPDSLKPAPDKLDWRDKGAVTHVKDQGLCGSCYIFSAVGNIEGQYALKHNKTLAFSEGQCLDCLRLGTCFGGRPDDIMEELAKDSGLMLENDYKYIDKKMPCKEDAKKGVAHVLGGNEIKIHDEDMLKQKLADIGPLSVALNAQDFIFYDGGILFPDECKHQMPDHTVVLVGYGEDDDGTKFWIIKNSWSTIWGEEGYMRLLRGVDACKMGTSYTASANVA